MLHQVPNRPQSTNAWTVHDWLLELAEKLHAAPHQTGQRLNPIGKPYVHAMSRQALCETLPYFRSLQGDVTARIVSFVTSCFTKKPTILATRTRMSSLLGLVGE
jgi:hypothetical protein